MAILHLLPLSRAEIQRRAPLDLNTLGHDTTGLDGKKGDDLLETLLKGGYPRLHSQDMDPQDWLANYVRTYVERDVQEVLRVSDLDAFGRFLGLCAGRSGQLVNFSSLAGDCGITHPTAKSWLSVLETSFIVKLLRPHHRNYNKRLVKSPKLYFLDTGLLCYLLRIRSVSELRNHPLRGAVFETFVHAELIKNFFNRGQQSDLFFWRDAAGIEVDFLVDLGRDLVPVEAKSGTTLASDFKAGLARWQNLSGITDGPAAVVYGGDESMRRSGAVVYSWREL